MIPDRTNYEIWLIDYLDGNLDPRQVAQLMSFLENNPDLKEELNDIRQYCVSPDDNSFRLKDNLKRSISDISESQFELMCVAALENDLSDQQASELSDILKQSSEKRKKHELIQKLRLIAPADKYRKKGRLIKQTGSMRIVRFSVAGLSAAATIAIMISLFNVSIQRNTSVAVPGSKDTNAFVTDPVKTITSFSAPEKKETKYLALNNNLSRQKTSKDEFKSSDKGSALTDSSFVQARLQPVIISKINFKENVIIAESKSAGTLVALKRPGNYISGTTEKPDFNSFIAKIFREKILKSKDQAQGKIKGFEIADAGITGLNKLLGWQMSLHKNKDEKGEIRSLYFSSRLLKFNAPVKKGLPLP